ncbi:pantoate--beta-alanine ligase [Hyphomonadaceae bacterium BL14]|nr:pantoate--beta-alanine ligase [Hyphomonadaceae bacterium BL14]
MTRPLPLVSAVSDLRAVLAGWRAAGLTIGFVPTMGALHAGHIALVTQALSRCDRVVASIFVNPAQFAPGEDFDAYPRTMDADAAKLAQAGCHLLFAPRARDMYPDGFATTVTLTGPAEGLESAARPHFFSGVATVVTKLLNQVRPDVAVFGEKDYQQLLVIRRLAADLDLETRIEAGDTVREADGLALSSRNAYLSPADRQRAGRLNVILAGFAAQLEAGGDIAQAEATALNAAREAFDNVDYVTARCAQSLAALGPGRLDRPARVLAAVRVGTTRLIDNRAASPSQD